VLGALGAAGLARGYNLVRGADRTEVAWTEDVLDGLAAPALLAYLAVAHHGRGRGDWAPAEQPAHWQQAVHEVLQQRAPQRRRLWAQRDAGEEALAAALAEELSQSARAVLARLHPPAAAAPLPAPA
jgi:hypothetical protein